MTARALLAAGALLWSLPGAQHGPVTLRQYAATVHTVRLRLDAIDANPTTAALAPVRSRMLRLPAVRLPGGRVVPTELSGLAGQLRAPDRDSVRRVTRAIDSLDHALSGVRAKPASPRGLRALDQVMRDPRFHPFRPPWAPIFDRLADLRSWIGDRIDDALGTSYSARGGFGFLLVVLIAAAGFVLARGALGRLVVDGTTEKAEEPVTGPTASALADERASLGDYRGALRYLFLATVLTLQERGVLELAPGRTNREYLLGLAGSTAAGERVRVPLSDLVAAFDRARYGHAPVDRDEYERCRGLARQAVEGARPEAA